MNLYYTASCVSQEHLSELATLGAPKAGEIFGAEVPLRLRGSSRGRHQIAIGTVVLAPSVICIRRRVGYLRRAAHPPAPFAAMSQLGLAVERTLYVGDHESHMLSKPHTRQASIARVLEHRLPRNAEEACDVVRISKSGALEAERRQWIATCPCSSQSGCPEAMITTVAARGHRALL